MQLAPSPVSFSIQRSGMGTTQIQEVQQHSTAYRLTRGPPVPIDFGYLFSNKTQHEGQKWVRLCSSNFLTRSFFFFFPPRLPSYVKFRISFIEREDTSILIFIKGQIHLSLFRFDLGYYKTSINVEIELRLSVPDLFWKGWSWDGNCVEWIKTNNVTLLYRLFCCSWPVYKDNKSLVC